MIETAPQSFGGKVDWAVLALLLVVGFVLRFGSALALPNIFRPDEIFQNLEPAHRLLTGTGVVTWEWRDGLRSWIFPGLLAGVMAVPERLGVGPIATLRVVTAAMSLLGCATIAAAFALGRRHFGTIGALMCGGIVTVWPDLLYFDPKPLGEIQASVPLCVAVALADALPATTRRRDIRVCAAIGVLLGLAFAIRFQLAPVLLLIAVWACRTGFRDRWLPLVLGAAPPLAAMAVADWLAWGTPFVSIWRNFSANIIEGRSHDYGTEPFVWYAVELIRAWGAAILPIAGLFVLGVRVLPLAATAALAIVVMHSFIAHKAYGFIYPAIPLALMVAGAGTMVLLQRLPALLRPPLRPWRLAANAVGIWLVVAVYVALSGDFPTRWRTDANYVRALTALAGAHDLCGLIAYDAPSPSYAYIGRPIPVYRVSTPDQFATVRAAGNYVLAPQALSRSSPGADTQCWGDLCVIRTGQECAPVKDYLINDVLAREGK